MSTTPENNSTPIAPSNSELTAEEKAEKKKRREEQKKMAQDAKLAKFNQKKAAIQKQKSEKGDKDDKKAVKGKKVKEAAPAPLPEKDTIPGEKKGL